MKKKKLAALKVKMDRKHDDWQTVQEESEKAAIRSHTDEQAAENARRVVKEAEDYLKKTADGAAGSAKEVEGEISSLKACREELRKAKDELKRLLEQSKVPRKMIGEESALADAKDTDAMTAQKREADLERQVEEAEKERAAREQDYQQAFSAFKRLEDRLDEAAHALKTIRAKEDNHGGIIYSPGDHHSACVAGVPSLIVFFSVWVSSFQVQ